MVEETQNEQTQENVPQQENAPIQENIEVQAQVETYGPRQLTFLTLVLKTFAGIAGGVAGSIILVLIFLATSSILQPVLSGVESELAPGEISPLFVTVLLGMIFATSLISSMVAPLLLSYTERERYTRISTAMGQIFLVNMVIFIFVLPIYLTTSTASIELTVYAAGLQVILSAMASALILELVHDYKYSLLAIYNTVLAILIAAGICIMVYYISGNATFLLFIALPVIWGLIGFFQAVVGMFYYWVFQTWGVDYLSSTTSFGTDYGIPDQTEEEEEEKHEDVEGGDFLNQ